MSTLSPQSNASHSITDNVKQEMNYEATVLMQINLEEQRFKAAMKADEQFETVKAIRERIKYLHSCLEKRNTNNTTFVSECTNRTSV